MFFLMWLHCGDFSRSGPLWCGCIIGNLSGSSPVCGVVGPWSLLWVDPGLNGTRCCSLLINQFLRSIYPLDKNILISRIFLFLRYTLIFIYYINLNFYTLIKYLTAHRVTV